MAYEYYVEFWGGAAEEIKQALEITEQQFWFDTREKRDQFVQKLRAFNTSRLGIKIEEGEEVRLQTIAKVVAVYKGKEYAFEYNFGYAYAEELAHYNFKDGNYSCDCNLSKFIQKNYPEIEELDCGDDITYKSFEVIKI